MTKYTKATLHANGEKQEFATAEDAKRLRAAFKAAYFKSSDGTVEYGVTADASTFVVLTIDTTDTPLAPKPNCDNYGQSDCLPSGIPVTGLTITQDSLDMTVGDVEKITITITPDDATNKEVNFITTGDAGVVSVDASGEVTALSAGSATVVVTTVDGGFVATVSVTVAES